MATRKDIVYDSNGQPVLIVGTDVAFRFTITTGDTITVTTAAAIGASTLSVKPLTAALSSGDRVRFGNLVVVLSADAAIGDQSLSLTATIGGLAAGSTGKKVQNLSGYTIQWIMKTTEGDDDADAILTKSTATSGVGISSVVNGEVDVTIPHTDTVDVDGNILISPGRYVYSLSRTDTGFDTCFAFGDVLVFLTASR